MSETTTENTAAEKAADYEKGSWQAALDRAASLFTKSDKDKKRASVLLWQGAQSAIGDWDSADDPSGEALYDELIAVMGAARKGDASKIKTVARAVESHDLDPADYKNLSQAYSAAVKLTKTAQVEAAEDSAIEEAVEALSESIPKSTSTIDGAAQILLSKGVDGAVVALLDVLGKDNFEAHRSLVRAFTAEISARTTAAAQAERDKKKAESEEARKAKEAERAKAKAAKDAEREAARKAKADEQATNAAPKAKAKAKAKPTSVSKGDANRRPLPPKAKASTAGDSEVSADEQADIDDLFDEVDAAEETEVEAPAPAKATKARPAVKRPAVKKA